MMISTSTSQTRQAFSLFHELAHLGHTPGPRYTRNNATSLAAVRAEALAA